MRAHTNQYDITSHRFFILFYQPTRDAVREVAGRNASASITSWRQHTRIVCRSFVAVRELCCFCSFLRQMEEGSGAKHQGLWESVWVCMHAFFMWVHHPQVSFLKQNPSPVLHKHKTHSQWVCGAVIGPQLLLGQSYWAKGTGQDSSTLFSNKLCIYLLPSTDESPQEIKQHRERQAGARGKEVK